MKRKDEAVSVISIRVPARVARELRARARREDRSLTALVRVFIRRALEADGGTALKTA